MGQRNFRKALGLPARPERASGTRWWLRAILLLVALSNSAAWAADVPSVQAVPGFNAGASALRVLGALAMVMALFLGGVWMFRNSRTLAWRRGRAPKLTILESRSLGARQALHVVRYQQKVFLVAAAPSGINLLTHLDPEEPAVPEPESAPVPASFAHNLVQALSAR